MDVWNHNVTVRSEFPQGRLAGVADKTVVADDVGTTFKAVEGTPKRSGTREIPVGSAPRIVSSPGFDASKEKKNANEASFGLSWAFEDNMREAAMKTNMATAWYAKYCAGTRRDKRAR